MDDISKVEASKTGTTQNNNMNMTTDNMRGGMASNNMGGTNYMGNTSGYPMMNNQNNMGSSNYISNMSGYPMMNNQKNMGSTNYMSNSSGDPMINNQNNFNNYKQGQQPTDKFSQPNQSLITYTYLNNTNPKMNVGGMGGMMVNNNAPYYNPMYNNMNYQNIPMNNIQPGMPTPNIIKSISTTSSVMMNITDNTDLKKEIEKEKSKMKLNINASVFVPKNSKKPDGETSSQKGDDTSKAEASKTDTTQNNNVNMTTGNIMGGMAYNNIGCSNYMSNTSGYPIINNQNNFNNYKQGQQPTDKSSQPNPNPSLITYTYLNNTNPKMMVGGMGGMMMNNNAPYYNPMYNIMNDQNMPMNNIQPGIPTLNTPNIIKSTDLYNSFSHEEHRDETLHYQIDAE